MGRGHRVTDVSYYLSEPTLSCKIDTAVVMPLCPIGFAEFSTLRDHRIVGKTDSASNGIARSKNKRKPLPIQLEPSGFSDVSCTQVERKPHLWLPVVGSLE